MNIHVFDPITGALDIRGDAVEVPLTIMDSRDADLVDNVAAWARTNHLIREDDLVGAFA